MGGDQVLVGSTVRSEGHQNVGRGNTHLGGFYSDKYRCAFAWMAPPGECRPERLGVRLREMGVEAREVVMGTLGGRG